MNKTQLNILYQSNDSYAAITGVSMYSLFKNNTDIDELTIYLLNDGISNQNIKKFKKLCKQYNRTIHIIDSKKILEKVKEFNLVPYKGTYTTYFKLFAFGMIETNNDTIMQVDGDTIITGSLKELCNLDMSKNAIAATYDCIHNGYKKMIGIPSNEGYYNCGVMFINQKLWRENKYEERIKKHLNEVRNKYFIVDQDIVNVLFRNEIKYLDLTYNFNCGFYIYGVENINRIYKLKEPYFHNKDLINQRIKNPLIIHCMGAMTGRPWEKHSTHPQTKLFDDYLYESPWKDFNKIEPKRSVIFKIQKTLYGVLPRIIYGYIHRFMQYIFLYSNNKKVLK